jgi:hypothetical protein
MLVGKEIRFANEKSIADGTSSRLRHMAAGI